MEARNEGVHREGIIIDWCRWVYFLIQESAIKLVEATRDYIASLSAADVVEVRHGRWIKHEGYDECSECHAKSIMGHNYCHSCGARMDKEDEHG